MSRSLVRDDHGNPLYFISQIQDISDRKALEEQLLHLASHDSLTGLYNRAAFGEQLDRGLSLARRTGNPLALLFLDLDDFKRVNDTLGHDAGDRLLAEVAKRLLDCVRAEDAVARLGDDEFCVLLENLPNAEGALRAAERIKACLEKPFVLGLRNLPCLTASIGIVVANSGEHTSAERLLNQADAAMYQAKRSGKAQHRLHLDLTSEDGIS